MLLRVLMCLCVVSVEAWSEDQVSADVKLMTTLNRVLRGDGGEMTPLAAFQQIVAQGPRLQKAYALLSSNRDPAGSAFYDLHERLWLDALEGPNELRRWYAAGYLAMRSPESRRYPFDCHDLAGKLADPSAANRILAWNQAGEDEPGRIMRQAIAASRQRPQRTLRVDGAATAESIVTWEWTWMPQGLGFWWTGALPRPHRTFTPIQRPLTIYRGERRGMFGSRTSGGRRKPTAGHPLETWRMVTSTSADLKGTHQESFPRTGLLRVGWPHVPLPPDTTVPTTAETTQELIIGAPGLEGDWTEVAVLPAPVPVRPGAALSLTAISTPNGALTVRLSSGTSRYAMPKLIPANLWILAVADGGRPTLVISQDEPTDFIVGVDGSLPPTMGTLEAGLSWETVLDLSGLAPGRHRVWVGFGPVKFDFGAATPVTLNEDFRDQPWPIDVWQGELITGPILVERPTAAAKP